MIKSISDLASTAFRLSIALKKEMVPNKDNVVIGIPLDHALAIHAAITNMAKGSERIEIPVMHYSGEYRTITVGKPFPAPEINGEPWMSLFEIEVFVT